jgi:oligopeptide transport system ATP-binding protein
MSEVNAKFDKNEVLIEAVDLCKYFKVGRGKILKAVDHVNLQIRRGETLGLVGESGCGKTTCGRTLIRMYDPTAGKILFKGEDISKFSGKKLLGFKKSRSGDLPGSVRLSGSPYDHREIVSEGMDVHFHLSNEEKSKKVNELLRKVEPDLRLLQPVCP